MSFGTMGTDREERINYERMREYRVARTRIIFILPSQKTSSYQYSIQYQ